MMEQECKFALIEFGNNNKTGWVIVKGGDNVCLSTKEAHTYWYPDNITQEEAECEVQDLIEHYENVAIFVPLPEGINIKILKRFEPVASQVNRSKSEVSAYGP